MEYCVTVFSIVVGLMCGHVYTRDVYMDSPTACGQTFAAGDREIFIVRPRGSVGVPNPPTSCRVHFESSYASSNYKFEIVVESAVFRDCGVSLSIFDGQSTGANYIRMLGCGSSTSTGHFYSKDRSITLLLTRTSTQYYHGTNFQLKVQLYYDTEGADEFIGTYKVPAGAIVGIVLGIIVLICAAILLGWCYKTGRLPGLSPYDYPSGTAKSNTNDLSKSDLNVDGGGSNNGGFVSWHNTETKTVESKSNFDLSDTRIWESLTSVNTNTSLNNPRKEIKPVQPVRPPIRSRDLQNGTSNGGGTRKPFERLDAKQLSNSPTARARGRRPMGDNAEKDEYHTISDLEREENIKERLIGKGRNNDSDKFVNLNPDKEGYMYDYDHVKKLSGDDENNTETKTKTQDFGTELRDAIKRASMKRQQSESNSDGQPLSGSDTQNDSSVFSSAAALNKQTDGETTGPEAQSSPKPSPRASKKKRKNSKERKKSGKKRESSPSKSKPNESDENNENVPPELYAPIFSGDDEPSEIANQYQPGYQAGYQPQAPGGQYDPRYPMGGYPAGMVPPGMYPPGMAPGVPYQQAGQAQWYVESNPNGHQKMAFAMTTHSQSDDSLQGNRGYPAAPNYTSTPYYNVRGRSGPNDKSMVPAGTILDDPQIPAPGTALMRYDDDPLSGVKTSQVVWTDAKRDPTDPPPDSSSQITRRTITRVTTRATEDPEENGFPDAPNPSLQDMSWRTAQGIQAEGGREPAFMSPTRSAYQPNAIQYANETPERSNAGYYMGGTKPSNTPSYIPNLSAPVVHDAPRQNDAIRDRITIHSESDH